MKRNKTARKRENKWRLKFLFLLLFSLLVGGCTYHHGQFAYFNMLDSEKKIPRNIKASERFWSAVRPISTLSASHYKLGRYYQQQGKHAKAIEEFSKAVRNDNRYCKAYNGIAMSYDALKRCEMAYNAYEQAIQCDPKEAYLYNNYACSRILGRDYEKGLVLLSKAGQLSKDNLRIKNNIKLAQMLVGQENNVGKLAPQVTTVELAAKTVLETAENENEEEKLRTDSIYEKFRNTASVGTQNVDVIGSVPVERAEKNSADSPVKMIALADHTPRMGKADKIWGFPTADASVASKETGNKLESSLPDNTVSGRLGAQKVNKITVQDHSVPPIFASHGAAIEVSNGNGVSGLAGRSADYLRGYGFKIGRITNAKYFRFNNSVISYREGYLAIAKELAGVIPGAQNIEKVDSLGRSSIGVRIILGKDLVKVKFPKAMPINRLEEADYIPSISNMDTLALTY